MPAIVAAGSPGQRDIDKPPRCPCHIDTPRATPCAALRPDLAGLRRGACAGTSLSRAGTFSPTAWSKLPKEKPHHRIIAKVWVIFSNRMVFTEGSLRMDSVIEDRIAAEPAGEMERKVRAWMWTRKAQE